MVRFLLIAVLICGFFVSAFATHNRAGEITYRHLSGLTYEVTITTCTKTSVIADRTYLKINWGDVPIGAELDSLERTSITFLGGLDAQINTYVGTHTYGGPGIFDLSVEDPNRNSGVLNIENSVDQIFCIASQLIITPQSGHNNSVVLLNPAKEQACVFKNWIHNPGAYDPDGDLLVYSLVPSMGGDYNEDGIGCDPIPGFIFPQFYSPNNDIFEIDPVTGDLTWITPQVVGEYNVGVKIEEWRMVNGTLMKVGHVIRDMQINVLLCTNNPPEITAIADTCVEANSSFGFIVSAFDPDGDSIDLSAVGGPFTEVMHTATFQDMNNGTGTFSWAPECAEIRTAPYQVLFKAEDLGNQVSLTDIEVVFITVVGPAVENLNAEALGSQITVTWNQNICVDQFTPTERAQCRYDVYRRNGPFDFEPSQCELGLPEYTGYQLIGTVNGLEDTTYVDAQGLFFGGTYCYRVVTRFPDGAESYTSEEVCAEIRKDQPVITNVSVVTTDASNGEVYIAWSPPVDLDTDIFPGPYHYELTHGTGYSGAANVIFSTPDQVELINEDTLYTHVGLNTLDNPNNYRVTFWSGGELVSFSSFASSVFLELIPDDNQMTLIMNHEVPWTNETYEVYRQEPSGGAFNLVGTATEAMYTDTGLVNNVSYCWFVRSIGTYGTPGVIDPLINDSQIACGKPYDLTPPCPPEITVDGDCESETVLIVWTNPNNSCADDVMGYRLYYAPVEGEDLLLYAEFDFENDTVFVFNEDGEIGSIAGCYAVTALDSLLEGPDGNLRRNESVLSDIFCVDNCPIYLLPNIFTPNNDGVNDVFIPYPYRFIESIDFQVFNRWGGLVYKTADPAIGWDGTDQTTGQVCTDGTYFYTVTANTIRLTGIVPEKFSGTIQLSDGKNPVQE
jgi:gliding motility-associated-like protein